MKRRTMLGAGLALASALALPTVAATPAAAPPAQAQRNGYVDGRYGQIHYRGMGQGPVVVLLHQTPWYSVEYAKVMPLLAAAGYRVIAMDTPGYGASAGPAAPPSIEDYADAVSDLVRGLGLKSVAVAGHHTGAGIAASFAQRHPEQARCIILHGPPLYTPAERAQRLAQPHYDQTPREDGSHLSDYFKLIRSKIAAGPGGLEATNWSTLAFFVNGEKEWYGHHAAFSYDMAPAIEAMRGPVLLLDNERDSLHAMALKVKAMRPDFRLHAFPPEANQVLYAQPELWTEAVAGFLQRDCGLKPARS